MSTATTDDVGEPTPDETIRRTVRALRSAYDVDARVLARYLGISRNSLYNRLNGTAPWLASEIAGLARYFGCEVVDFYTGNVHIDPAHSIPDDRTTRWNPRPNRPVLALIPGGRADNTAGQARSTAAPQHAATSTPRPAAVS